MMPGNSSNAISRSTGQERPAWGGLEAVPLWYKKEKAYARVVRLATEQMVYGSELPTASMPAYASMSSDDIYSAIPSIDRVASAMSASHT